MRFLILLMIVTPRVALSGIVADVRTATAAGNVGLAQKEVTEFRRLHGSTPELVLADSWVSRGYLALKQYDEADKWAQRTHDEALGALHMNNPDSSPELALALGSSIETRAAIMNARGEKAQAVEYLRREVAMYEGTSIATRIQKNLNLLSLEGKPAPPLAEDEWLGEKPAALSSLKDHPVLLFFWAHWCADCKGEISTIARIKVEFEPRGLRIIGPTQRYGYVGSGDEASKEVETQYIEQVRQKYYARIGNMAAPVSEANFRVYGASTTPTLVLIDKHGIVNLYHPGKMSYEELASRIAKLL